MSSFTCHKKGYNPEFNQGSHVRSRTETYHLSINLFNVAFTFTGSYVEWEHDYKGWMGKGLEGYGRDLFKLLSQYLPCETE
jgi:hypothetical protein